jgi:hypothetical protein
VEVKRQLNAFDRETFKYITAQQAMAAVLRKAATGLAWAEATGSRP